MRLSKTAVHLPRVGTGKVILLSPWVLVAKVIAVINPLVQDPDPDLALDLDLPVDLLLEALALPEALDTAS